VGNLI